MTADATPPWPIYTCYLEHFETGLGLRQQVMVGAAQDEQDARTQFWEELYAGYEESSRDYFGDGLRVTEGVDRELLAHFLAPGFIDRLEHRIRWGQLSFSWQFNLS